MGSAIQKGYMGGYPPHVLGPARFPGTGGAAIDGADPAEAGRRKVGVHIGRGSKGGGGV